MLPVSDAFLAALASSQQVSTRADLLKGGQVIYSGLPITGGQVTFTRSSIASRSLSCTLAPTLDLGSYVDESVLLGGRLGVYGHEIRPWWTLHYSDGSSEAAPLGRFRIDTMSGSLAGGEVSISGTSREAYVADDTFVAPRTISGPSARSLIVSLIRESLGSAEVVVSATRDCAVQPMTVESDRWGAIATLAASIVATVRCDGYGRFVVADAPTADSAPAWRISAGPGGALVSADLSVSRARVRNAWVVQGSTPEGGTVPIQAVAYDDSASSPTRYGDPDAGYFGRVPGRVTIDSLTDLAMCQQAANARLAQTCGAAQAVNLDAVPNPAIECGDVIDITHDAEDPAGSTRRHIVDSGSFSLIPGGAFGLSTRDLREVGDE